MKKLEILSQISRDIGQVLFASMFIAPIMDGALNWQVTILGLILALGAWYMSILLGL